MQTSGSDAFPYATQARDPGPNVLLGLVAKDPRPSAATPTLGHRPARRLDAVGDHRFAQPRDHGQRTRLDDLGFGVVWNSTADSFLIQQPPGTQNWGIGLLGKIATATAPGSTSPILPTGTIDSLGKPVAPKSLYLAQLCLRLGPSALKNLGY